MKKDKIIKMVEIEVDLEEDTIEKITKFALETIKNDKKALINYGVNKLLEKMIEREEKKGKKKAKVVKKKGKKKKK